ncbi:diaminopimelate decarboxylase [archaeon SCG-AAA382B04]|nr:diaminopimelate decarboxylase [archaeon SCG-AAA382B04]
MNRSHLKVKESLYIEEVDTTELAEEYVTPLYVTSRNAIRENYNQLKKSLNQYYEKNRIHFACKANTNLNVLKTLNKEGCWIDAVSVGEVHSALEAEFPREKILFTGTSVSEEELEYLVERDIRVNIDSLNELERLREVGETGISFRVNPGVGAGHHDHCITGGEESKFGIWEDDIVKAYERAQELNYPIKGIHMHIGSGINDPDKFVPALERMMDIAGEVANQTGVKYEFIDIGGGLGIPYRPNEEPLDLDEFSQKITQTYKQKLDEHGLGQPYLALEPGRFLVGDASILLTNVNDKKTNPFHKYIGVDAGFNTLLRPAMYGSYHGVVNASEPMNAGRYIQNAPKQEVDRNAEIAGPLCESGDLLAKDRPIEAQVGQTLAILDVGAYGYAMTLRYNTRPLPAEVMVEENKHQLIREREDLDDLLEKQVMPDD